MKRCSTSLVISSVQFSHSVMSNSLRCHWLQYARLPWPTSRACSISSRQLVMPSNYLILCQPLLLLSSVFLSISVFSSEWVLCIRWPKYWSFSICPSSEYSGLISFRIDWFDVLASFSLSWEKTLKSLLQHHSLKALPVCLTISCRRTSRLFPVLGYYGKINCYKPSIT